MLNALFCRNIKIQAVDHTGLDGVMSTVKMVFDDACTMPPMHPTMARIPMDVSPEQFSSCGSVAFALEIQGTSITSLEAFRGITVSLYIIAPTLSYNCDYMYTALRSVLTSSNLFPLAVFW